MSTNLASVGLINARRLSQVLDSVEFREGADIKTDNIAIEVETPERVNDASRQLQGHQKPVYIAGTNKQAVEKALQATKATTIGVMDNQRRVVKRSTRK